MTRDELKAVVDHDFDYLDGMANASGADANTLVVGEAFEVLSGKIMMIQTVMADMPAHAWN